MEKLLTYVGDGMGMRVPYMLLLRGQSEFIDILSNELSKNVEISIYDEMKNTWYCFKQNIVSFFPSV